MKNERRLSSLIKKEHTLIVFCVLVAALCVIAFIIEPTIDRFFNQEAGIDDRNAVGEITYSKHDTRHRASDSIVWKKARVNSRVHIGDSVFTGAESLAKIALKDGNSLILDENSLVHFSGAGNKPVNLVSGNFLVSVHGYTKIAVNGQPLEIEADNSEIQIYLNETSNPIVSARLRPSFPFLLELRI